MSDSSMSSDLETNVSPPCQPKQLKAPATRATSKGQAKTSKTSAQEKAEQHRHNILEKQYDKAEKARQVFGALGTGPLQCEVPKAQMSPSVAHTDVVSTRPVTPSSLPCSKGVSQSLPDVSAVASEPACAVNIRGPGASGAQAAAGL